MSMCGCVDYGDIIFTGNFVLADAEALAKKVIKFRFSMGLKGEKWKHQRNAFVYNITYLQIG